MKRSISGMRFSVFGFKVGNLKLTGNFGVLFYSVVTLPQVLDILLPAGKISQETANNTLSYLKANRYTIGIPILTTGIAISFLWLP